MESHGIHVVETAVGDRYILEALDANGWVLGGEQSGHIMFRDLATTGDGELTGLQVMDVMARTGRALSDLAAVMTRLPQVLLNVRGRRLRRARRRRPGVGRRRRTSPSSLARPAAFCCASRARSRSCG